MIHKDFRFLSLSLIIAFSIALLLNCKGEATGNDAKVIQDNAKTNTSSGNKIGVVNLIYDDGTILVYKDKSVVIPVRTKLDVIRNSEAVGKLEVVESKDVYIKCNIIGNNAALQEMDGIYRTSNGNATFETNSNSNNKETSLQEKPLNINDNGNSNKRSKKATPIASDDDLSSVDKPESNNITTIKGNIHDTNVPSEEIGFVFTNCSSFDSPMLDINEGDILKLSIHSDIKVDANDIFVLADSNKGNIIAVIGLNNTENHKSRNSSPAEYNSHIKFYEGIVKHIVDFNSKKLCDPSIYTYNSNKYDDKISNYDKRLSELVNSNDFESAFDYCKVITNNFGKAEKDDILIQRSISLCDTRIISVLKKKNVCDVKTPEMLDMYFTPFTNLVQFMAIGGVNGFVNDLYDEMRDESNGSVPDADLNVAPSIKPSDIMEVGGVVEKTIIADKQVLLFTGPHLPVVMMNYDSKSLCNDSLANYDHVRVYGKFSGYKTYYDDNGQPMKIPILNALRILKLENN